MLILVSLVYFKKQSHHFNMQEIIFTSPINSLSFGNVSYNFLKQFYKLGVKVHFFPMGKDLDFSAFDKIDDDFKDWVKSSYQERFMGIKKDIPHLKMWHINSSESSITGNNFLYTFHELSEPTDNEISICNLHKGTIFSSSYSKHIFSGHLDNCYSCPIGFDEDFFETDKQYLKNKIHFGLMGKFEKRKHTHQIISNWVERFGDDTDYQLTCCVNNPFLSEDDNYNLILNALGNKRYKNVNILPKLKTNSEVNELMNSFDVDLTGLSGAEGWNLPSFNSTCLGKWSIVLDCTSHKDWANEDNSILVEPEGSTECYDGIFFKKDSSYNHGSIYTFSKESFNKAIDKALDRIKSKNENGRMLKDRFSYQSTINKIIDIIHK